MKLIKEHSAVGCFPIEIPNPCFFHMRGEYCCLSHSERKLYKSNGKDMSCLDLGGEYRRLFHYGGAFEYFAYTWMKQRNEVALRFLDQSMREFDMLKLAVNNTGAVEDMWLDGDSGLVYFVFPFSIQVYNLNGDFLRLLMKAPVNTRYKAISCEGNRLFTAYERSGCIYVAEYDCCGTFREKLGIGSGFWVENMELLHTDSALLLNVYGKRPEKINVCVEILIEAFPCAEAECPEPSPEEKKLYVELSMADGVGSATCHLCSLEASKDNIECLS